MMYNRELKMRYINFYVEYENDYNTDNIRIQADINNTKNCNRQYIYTFFHSFIYY